MVIHEWVYKGGYQFEIPLYVGGCASKRFFSKKRMLISEKEVGWRGKHLVSEAVATRVVGVVVVP